MYKVFVNERPIILTDMVDFSTNLPKEPFGLRPIDALFDALFQTAVPGLCLLCDDLETAWRLWQAHCNIEEAAGGKVLNTEGQVLFIYRYDKWDLPKGKREPGEALAYTARREVEEECGVDGLTIKQSLPITYHVFKKNKTYVLKITHWFLMHTDFKGIPSPQAAEGIGQAQFKSPSEISQALKNTYENIKLLF
ncbi:MAG: NUDIX domain-containing protein [Lutibacter sp.]|nr:NUDIX domain-containing protein [Lutibacter sp.]